MLSYLKEIHIDLVALSITFRSVEVTGILNVHCGDAVNGNTAPHTSRKQGGEPFAENAIHDSNVYVCCLWDGTELMGK